MVRPGASTLVWLAYAGVVLIGGANFVAVSISNEGLPPFWGAAFRFGLAAYLMLGAALMANVALPRGKALVGAVLYGTIAFGAAYALAYWALLSVPAGMLSVMLATTPLLTAFLAPLHGLEKLRLPVVFGGLLAVAGVGVVLREQLTLAVPASALVASVLFGFAAAESSVIIKRVPRAHPLATNAVAMGAGAVLLATLSAVVGETWAVPPTARIATAFGYLVVIGSIILFGLFLYTLARLPVTVTVFQFALMPLVTVLLASWLLHQAATWSILLGAGLVGAGVYVGVARPHAKGPPTAADAAPPPPKA